MKCVSILISFTLIAFACSDSKKIPAGKFLGKLDPRLDEASGLAVSLANPGFLWTLNDSGNPAEVFLIDDHAAIRLVCKLERIENRDWEDISIEKGVDGRSYLLVGDIGDNLSRYSHKIIYRFEEPVLADQQTLSITKFDTLYLKMPDGGRDTETLMVDPPTHDLYVISKREGSVRVYMTHNPFSKDTLALKKVMKLPYPGIVGGSISFDGSQILLKSYDKIYYWRRAPGQSIVEALSAAAEELPYNKEPQGEAIAWSIDGESFYTVSESPPLRHAGLIMYRMADERKKIDP